MKQLLTTLALLAPVAFAQAQGVHFVLQPNPPLSGIATCHPYDLAVADVNGDGRPDVLTANFTDSTLGILLGDGAGGFVLQPNLPMTGGGDAHPYSLAVADVNGDGRLDVLTVNAVDSTLGVLLGDGQGGFVLQPSRPATGTGRDFPFPHQLFVADFNGDGRLDVLAANTGNATLGILLGDGQGGFVLQPNSPATGTGNGNYYYAAVADVNGDTRPDALVVNSRTRMLWVWLGDGQGGFAPTASPAALGTTGAVTALAVADVNGDGRLDVVVSDNRLVDKVYKLRVLLGDGQGGFAPPTDALSPSTAGAAFSLAVADVNGDGQPDVLTATFSHTVDVLLGDGTGRFALQPGSPASGGGAQVPPPSPMYIIIQKAIVLADVNGDGRPDALVANAENSRLGSLLNTPGLLPSRAALPGTAASLYPNPARDHATLALTGLPPAATQVQATLLDALGRAVARQPVPVAAGRGQAQLPLSGLSPGLYTLRLQAQTAAAEPLGELPAQWLSIQ